MKSESYIMTPSKLFSSFALGSNSLHVVAFVKYQNDEMISSFTLFVSYGLASRRYYLFDKKSQNSYASVNTLMVLICRIKT